MIKQNIYAIYELCCQYLEEITIAKEHWIRQMEYQLPITLNIQPTANH